jgi:hypothetical protein
MLALRQAWFDECGAPPPGNKLALERKAWQVCPGRGMCLHACGSAAACCGAANKISAAVWHVCARLIAWHLLYQEHIPLLRMMGVCLPACLPLTAPAPSVRARTHTHTHTHTQSAVDAGAISARARPAAAADKARELQAALRARGCVEEFVPDPTLLSEGQVDFMQPDHSSGGAEAAGAAADAAAAAAAAAASASARPVRTGTAVVDGQAKQYTVTYLLKHATRGGHIFDVRMTFDHMDTEHRCVCVCVLGLWPASYHHVQTTPAEAGAARKQSLVLCHLPHAVCCVLPAERCVPLLQAVPLCCIHTMRSP